MTSFTTTELPISETDKKLVALAPAVSFTKTHVMVQSALYILFAILFIWSGYVVSGISADSFLEKLFYWFFYFFALSCALWMLFGISGYIQKEFILNTKAPINTNVKRFLLRGDVYAKRYETVAHEIDEYYISLSKDYELKVYPAHFNSCKEGDSIEIKMVIMDYKENLPFPNRGIIIESLSQI